MVAELEDCITVVDELSQEVAEQVTDDEIAAREARENTTERPADCGCWGVDADLPCFRDGFDSQNPAEPTAESDE